MLKLELETVEEADKALERGLVLFSMHISLDQMERDEFVNILTCFKCYQMDDHTTKNCKETKTLCSECGGERTSGWSVEVKQKNVSTSRKRTGRLQWHTLSREN